MRICHKAGIYAVAPWYAMVEAYKDYRGTEEYAGFRQLGLGMDELTVKAFQNIILTGDKISEGMDRELIAIETLWIDPSPHIINCIGIPDNQLEDFLRSHATNQR